MFIIDYFFAQEQTNTALRQELFGTSGYIAPEIIKSFNRSPRSDVYATGITVSMLLGDSSAYCLDSKDSDNTTLNFQEKLNFPNLFKNISAPPIIRTMTDKLVKSMTDFDFMKRCNIAEAMASWQKIIDLNDHCERDNKFQATKNFTPTYSNSASHWFLDKPQPPRTPSFKTGITQFSHQPSERKCSVA